MSKSEEKKISRRSYVQVAAGTIAGLVVGGAFGYLAKPTVTGPPTAGTTETQTVTQTAAQTVTIVPSTAPQWRVVWAWGCSWFTGYIPAMVAASTICKMLNMEIVWQGVSDCADIKYADYITSKLPSLDPERDAIVVHYIHALSEATKKALDRGLGVFASNADDYTVPEYQRNRLSYVGQDEYQAGRVNALYITGKGLLKKGDRVVICMPQRGIEPHERRAQGLESVLDTETGCVVDYISGWGSEIAKIPEQLAAYYRGHPDVKAFFAVEGGLGQGFEAFMRSVDLAPGSMPNIMWDPTEATMKSIRNGYITGSDDQQFYLQGFLPPVIIWLWKNAFTHFMAPVSINVGATIVDKSNVDVFEKFQAACVEQVKALGWFTF